MIRRQPACPMRSMSSNPLRLFNKVWRHFCAMPRPPAPARRKGERGPGLAMEAASLISIDMARPLRGEADPVEHPEQATACDKGDKAAVERDAKDLIRVITQRAMPEPFRRAEPGGGCGNVPAGPVIGKPVQSAPRNAAQARLYDRIDRPGDQPLERPLEVRVERPMPRRPQGGQDGLSIGWRGDPALPVAA